jgi:hypothetical protein
MLRFSRAALVLGLAFALVGCDSLAGMFADDEQPTAKPCGQAFNAVRCLAMTDAVASRLHTTREDVISLEIMPEPTPQVIDGVTIIQTRGGAAPIELRVTLADGSTHLDSMCGGIPSGPACMDEPQLETGSVTRGGYHDVPQGASPVPSPAPDALSAATELRIDRRDIPIDHTGPQEVRLGEAWLPNGLLTTADFALVDDWPPGVTIIEGGVNLEIRSIEDGKPLWNIYEHGWRESTERVEAILIFDVFRFEPGATLSIRDVVVR